MKGKLSEIWQRRKRASERQDHTNGGSRKKLRLIVLVIVAVIVVCVFGAVKIYNRFHGGTVNVYAFSDIGLESMMVESDSEIEGTVSTDQLQTEYLSDSQTVDQVYVKKGQKVKVGDKLFSYDSTLDQLDLQRKSIEVQRKELELTQAKKRLAILQTYRAGVPVTDSVADEIGDTDDISSEDSDDEEDSELRTSGSEATVLSLANVTTLGAGDATSELAGLELLGGDGTEENPYCYYWQSNFYFSDRFIEAVMQGKDEAFVRFAVDGDDITLPEAFSDITVTQPDDEDEDTQSDSGDTTDEDAEEGSENVTVETEAQRSAAEVQAVPMTLTTQTPQVTLLGGSSEDSGYFGCWTMQFQKTSYGYRYLILSINVGGYERKIADPLPALSTEEDPDVEEPGTDGADGDDGEGSVEGTIYTRSQLAQLLAQQQKEITQLDRDLRKLKIEYEKQQLELDENTVYAKVDGVITKLRSPKKAGTEKVFVQVSGDGAGYTISGTVSELELDKAVKGASVTVVNEDLGEEYQGTVAEVMNYPTTSSYWGMMGNSNVSYYPFTISVDDSAEFGLDDYITIQFNQTEEESESVYLMKCFIRSEDGKSYIYVANEEGVLEKRYVTTGKDVWGYYTEIKSGLSESEQVAFPYGQHVREGAPTTEASIETLYGE
jgi:multidrug efflux pump subunit AcrA (membrane-fusion protein)